MLIRRPKANDVPAIQKIAERAGHPLVDSFDQAAVVENDGEVSSFGVLRRNLEAIIYTSGRPRDRVEALTLLIEQAIEDAKSLKHDDIYIFAKDEAFAEVLIRKFGCRRASGIPLILDLKNE